METYESGTDFSVLRHEKERLFLSRLAIGFLIFRRWDFNVLTLKINIILQESFTKLLKSISERRQWCIGALTSGERVLIRAVKYVLGLSGSVSIYYHTQWERGGQSQNGRDVNHFLPECTSIKP